MAIETSRMENMPQKVLDTFYLRSAVAAFLAVIPGALIYLAVDGLIPKPWPLVPVLGIPFGTFLMAEYLFRGEYPRQRLEAFFAWFEPKESHMDFSEGTSVKRTRMGDLTIDAMGQITVAARITTPGILADAARMKIQSLLSLVVEGATLQAVKITRRAGSESLASRLRPGLVREWRVMETDFYVAMRFPVGTVSRGGMALTVAFVEAIETHFPGSDILSPDEIARVNEWILSPTGVKGSGVSPQLSDTHVFRAGAAEVGPEDFVAQSASLVNLPEEIDHGFSELFDELGGVQSIVNVQFLGVGQNHIANVAETMAARRGVPKADADATLRQQSVFRRALARARGSGVSLEMFCNVIVWESRAKGTAVLQSLIGSARARTILKRSEGSIVQSTTGNIDFRRDHAYIAKSLLAAQLGSGERIKTRAFDVSSVQEASYYSPRIPLRVSQRYEPTLFFPGIDNTPVLFSHIESPSHPGFAVVAESGSGKSALVALLINTALERQVRSGPIAMAINDVGGTYSISLRPWAKFYLPLERGAPMAMHPLRAFMAFDNYFLTALGFVVELLTNAGFPVQGSTAAQALSPTKLHLVREALEEFYETARTFSLLELHEIFKKHLDPNAPEWREHFALFAEYLPGGLFGTTFSPSKASHDLPDPRILYTNIPEYKSDGTDEVILRWMRTSISFIHKSMELHAGTYNANASVLANRLNNFHVIEEYKAQKGFLSVERVTNALSQIRKKGAILGVVTQRADDFLGNGENPKELQESFARWWILDGSPPARVLKIALGQDSTQDDSDDMLEAQADIQHLRRLLRRMVELRSKGEPWAVYIDNKQSYLLRIQIERSFLWRITTDAGGIKMRKRALELRPDMTEEHVCQALADKGPWPIPREVPSSEFVDAWVLHAFGAAHKPGGR